MKSVKKVLYNSVDSSGYLEQELQAFPDKFTITRVRAEIRSGTANQVALVVRQKSNSTNAQDIALEYDLTSNLDYIEQAVCFAYKRKDTDYGKIFIGVKTNSIAPSVVLVTLEYEVV